MSKRYTPIRRLAATLALGVAATAGHAQMMYCTPVCSSPCNIGLGDKIESFVADAGMPQVISNLNTGCSGNPNNYTFYNTLYADAPQGGTVNWGVQNGGEAMYYRLWVDWNNDGTFTDAGELMGDTSVAQGALYSGSFAVPPTATLGEHRMRVAGSWNMPYFHACDTFWYGETEDYILNVTTSGVPCTGTPDGGMAMAMPAGYCTGQPVVLHVEDNTSGSGITIQWQSSTDGGGTWTDINTATTAYYTLLPTGDACYRAAITCTGGGMAMTAYSTTVCITEADPAVCGQDSVWPGDANADQVANLFDAFPIYLHYGDTGAARAAQDNNWVGHAATNWTNALLTGANPKHADCNGDGTVDSSDFVAISQNYGLTHNKPGQSAYKGTGLPDLYPDFTGISLTPGATVTVPIRFGSAGSPTMPVYAMAGTVSVGGVALTAPATAAISTTGLLGSSAKPFVHANSAGSIDWAAGRTNGSDAAAGSGQVASVTFTVPATTPAGTAVMVMLNNVEMIDHLGMPLTGFNMLNDTAIVQAASGVGHAASGIRRAAIYPNPAAGAAVLSFAADVAGAGTLRITDIAGRVLATQDVAVTTGRQEVALPVANLPAGAYFVELRTAQGGVETLRFVKQ